MSSSKVKRLFDQFQPSHYLLDINIDQNLEKFNGAVIISGQKTGRPSKRISFHQNGLKITKAHVVKNDQKGDINIDVERINNHEGFDEVRIHSKENLYPGSYTITLEFNGKITRNMHGVYPCHFTYKGKEKRLLATQFESHHAREVFPCIDEPEAKATFKLSLSASSGQTFVSNTPIESQTTKAKITKTTFEITPKMSTYLLAFVIGELDYKEAKTNEGVVVRTYATPDNVKHTDFALEVAVKCLEFFDEYFAIDYPLVKCDFLALPDFASGAMENWGCITFREQTLLVDPKNSTLSTKQYVALVIAHELAHQWFGNLVTMRWWTDLWLNEGFASWIEYLAIDHIFPDWHLWEQFVVDERQQAMKLDALENTHPVEVPVNHPDEIRTIFDAISYSKGASVIHMLNNYLGAEEFKNGLRHYLRKYQYKNTDTIDLWNSLQEIADKPVAEFMNHWTSTSGFPLLQANFEENKVDISQTRFFLKPDSKKISDQKWPIPLLSNNDLIPIEMSEKSITVNGPFEPSTILNYGQSGFYRTIYNPTHLEELGRQIDRGRLSSVDRLGLLTDLFEASKAGYADTVEALYFLRHFKNEDDYLVWDSVAGIIGSIRLAMDDEDLRENMKPFIRQLVSGQVERLGWDAKKNELHFDRLLRPIIFGLAASADEEEIVKHCRNLFSKIESIDEVSPQLKIAPSEIKIKRALEIDADMRGTVFGTVARLGNMKDFNKLVNLHNTAHLTEEKTTLAAAVTGFKEKECIQKALEMITSKDVRLQDISYWIAYSFLNRHARKETWEWLKNNWGWLEKNIGGDMSFYRMPLYAARVFSNDDFAKDYEKFFKPKMSPALERSYLQGLEILKWQTAWKKQSLKEVKAFFSQAKLD